MFLDYLFRLLIGLSVEQVALVELMGVESVVERARQVEQKERRDRPGSWPEAAPLFF